jgi:hypothetical protein
MFKNHKMHTKGCKWREELLKKYKKEMVEVTQQQNQWCGFHIDDILTHYVNVLVCATPR